MSVEVRHDEAQNQYTILDGDRPVGFAAYEITGNEIAFTHTEVDPTEQGKGLAAVLVQHALDDVAANTELRVVPACSYVAMFVKKNAQYEELTRR